MTAPFSIQGGKLVTKNLVLSSPEAGWRANGSLSFDGMLDYAVELELGEQLASQFRKRAGSDVAALLANSSGKVTLDLHVAGPAAHPEVTLDMTRLAQRAASNIGNTARERLDEAGKRLLQQLQVGGKPSPKDSTVRADSAQAPPPTIQDALKGLLKRK
jgi:hypothetical protein